MNKLILFELNEVPMRILDYYRKMRPESWLAKNYNKIKKYETISENQGHLSPWNTWPTLHRGVASHEHFISDFNLDLTKVDTEFPPVWDILSKQNVDVGVFGSLHSYPLPNNAETYKYFVPDVFAAGSECFPNYVEMFQEFNLRLSRNSARNVDKSVPVKDMFKFLLNLNKLGIKFSTTTGIAGQLVNEKTTPWKIVRRRTYQTVLSFDVFYKLLETTKPSFTTFFTNHVASSMHRYWAASFPEDYEKMNYDKDWIQTYDNEILFTMDKTDAMLKRLGEFVDKNPAYKLLIASSMGQEAIESEPIETQLYIVNFEKFISACGITSKEDYTVMPAMLPQFNVHVKESKLIELRKGLDGFTINGEKIQYRETEGGRFSIDLGHPNLSNPVCRMHGTLATMDSLGLENVIIEDKSSSTAYHIPEGHLFSYHPSHQDELSIISQVPTCEILSQILNNFKLERPGYAAKTAANIF